MKRSLIIFLVFLAFIYNVIAIDYSNYCEDNYGKDLATCNNFTNYLLFTPIGCNHNILECEINTVTMQCETRLIDDYTNCSVNYPGIGCYDNTAYLLNSEESCLCRGTKFQEVNQCGNPTGEYSPCLVDSVGNPCTATNLNNCVEVTDPICTVTTTQQECDIGATNYMQKQCNTNDNQLIEFIRPVFKPACCLEVDDYKVFMNGGINSYCVQTGNTQVYNTTICPNTEVCWKGTCQEKTCSFVEDILGIKAVADIDQPKYDTYVVGESIPFKAASDADTRDFVWSFGDGDSAYVPEIRHKYNAPGTYSVGLEADTEYDCPKQDTKTLTIVPCVDDNECDVGDACINGACETAPPAIQPPPLMNINIIKPENQEYYSETVEVQYFTSSPATCWYNLNNEGVMPVLQNPFNVQAEEGNNVITIGCDTIESSRQFTVKLPIAPEDQVPGIVQDVVDTETSEETETVFAELEKSGEMTITKLMQIEGSQTTITFRIKNNMFTALNTQLRLTIPKSIAESASEIQSGMDFMTIQDDPMIEFDLGDIAPDEYKQVKIKFNKVLSQEDIGRIITQTFTNIDEILEALAIQEQMTAAASSIERTAVQFEEDGQPYVQVVSRFVPEKNMKNVSIYEMIPKCLVEHIDELDIPNKEKIKIINPDPLIVWHFEEINKPVEWTYRVKGILDEDCIEEIRNLAIADELGLNLEEPKGEGFGIWIPIFIALLIVILLVYFAKYSHEMKKDITERERGKTETKPKNMKRFLDKQLKKAEKDFKRSLKK